MTNPVPHSENIEDWTKSPLFELVPFNIALIDSGYNIIAANNNFEEYFGEWKGRKCYQVYKELTEPCPDCQAETTFKDSRVRVSDETGTDRHNRTCHYVVHLAPVTNKKGKVAYVLEMSTDITETKRWQRQYNLLFERAACYISVIDRNFRIIRANEAMRKTFGEVAGMRCYRAFKQRSKACPQCPARATFEDGKEHSSHQTGKAKDGSNAHYVVSTSPLSQGGGKIQHIIEIATDVTQVHLLEEELRQNHDIYVNLINSAADGIIAADTEGKVRIFNPAAKEIIGWRGRQFPALEVVEDTLKDISVWAEQNSIELQNEEILIRNLGGSEIPLNIKTNALKSKRKKIGDSILLKDLREIKKLEKEKLDAERLGAVGQTVAGLAHTIKNLLMGLEGGMYIVDSGLRLGKQERITEGWAILQRNFEKTTSLVKDFLSFAKGKKPVLRRVDPVELASSVVALYKDAAAKQGVELVLDAPSKISKTPLDPEGLEACLTNLISNGIDAAVMGEESGGKVILKVCKDEGALIFSVTDNGCGMDAEIKQKVFTTFFTTKGGKGTGLGLLTTRKIVQEHGGSIDISTKENEGSTLTIRLPLCRLTALEKEQSIAKIKE